MLKGAIFDVDGVLLDSLGMWKELGAQFLLKRGISPEPELVDILFSMSMEEGAEYLISKYKIGESLQGVIEDLELMIRDFYYNKVEIKDGVEDVLKFLSDNKVKMVVASSSPNELIKKALERNGILKYFENIFTTSEAGESKHSPKIFHISADYLGFEPSEIMVFEDSLYALKTAVEAGFYGIGVFDKNGERNQEDLKRCGRIYCKSLRDIFNLPLNL